jgi:hypothetical protein
MCKNKGNDSSKESENKFILEGHLENFQDDKIYLLDKATGEQDSAKVADGKFTFKGDYPVPTVLTLRFTGGYIASVCAENTTMKVTGDLDNERTIKVIGGQANADMNRLREESIKTSDKYGYGRSMLMEKFNPKTSKERLAEIDKVMDTIAKLRNKREVEFVKNNPKSHYAAYIVSYRAKGCNIEDTKKWLAMLDPSLNNTPIVKRFKAKMDELGTFQSSLNKFLKGAENVNYKVDNTYKGSNIKGITYLAMLSDNNLCGLKKDGTVLIINKSGEKISEFKADIKGEACAIATDESDNIYISVLKKKACKVKIRGKLTDSYKLEGSECHIYNKKGIKQNSFNCEKNKLGSGIRVLKGKLLLSDSAESKICIYEVKTGKFISEITNLRPCCGMLDFSINKEDQLLVANLGAFRVQLYDLTGKSLMYYGKRGKGLNDFHGCCNPVSVASLNNGALVTVEKSPTRVKIYCKGGAKQIDGIQELVKGCSYIPMTVDTNDNLYLASGEKGLVKCVTKS